MDRDDINLTEEDLILIKESLLNHILFRELTLETINLILENLITLDIKKGYFLFQEGDSGSFFYILKEGDRKSVV